MLDLLSILHFHPLHLRLGCADFTDFTRESFLHTYTLHHHPNSIISNATPSLQLISKDRVTTLERVVSDLLARACQPHCFLASLRVSSENSRLCSLVSVVIEQRLVLLSTKDRSLILIVIDSMSRKFRCLSNVQLTRVPA